MIRGLWVCVAVLLLCSSPLGAVTPATATPTAQQATPATPTPTNETQQENPDSVEDGQYSAEAAQWLSGALAERLRNGTIELSQHEYDRARQYLDEDYQERLSQYVDVASDTDNEAATQYEHARQNERALVNQTQRYQRLHTEYEQARENDNERRARRLAKQLERTAANVSERRQRLNANLAHLTNLTGIEFATARGNVNETADTIVATQATVRTQSLVVTTLNVRAQPETASFVAPTTLHGTVRQADGEPVRNERLRLVIAGHSRTVRTNATGAFTTMFRPRALPLGEQSVTVRYRPNATSLYLGNTTTVDVTIQQVTPTMNATVTPRTVGYGDKIRINGSVTAGSRGVDDIPIEIAVEATVIGQTATNASGHIERTVRLPATVNDGNRTLTVRVPYDDQAIAGVDTSSAVTVEQRPTNLSITARPSGQRIAVAGTLTTADGQPVREQAVSLAVANGQTRVVDTAPNGSFKTSLAVPSNSTAGDTVAVTGSFDQPSTNLQKASATTEITIPAAAGSGPSDESPSTGTAGSDSGPGAITTPITTFVAEQPAFASALAIAGIGLSIILVARRQGIGYFSGQSDAEPTDSATAQTGTDTQAQTPAMTEEQHSSFVDVAENHIANGNYDLATEVAFTTLRNEIVSAHDVPETATHWDVVAWSRQNGFDDAQIQNLETTAELFEKAAYAPTAVSRDEAEAALDATQRFNETEQSNQTDTSA